MPPSALRDRRVRDAPVFSMKSGHIGDGMITLTCAGCRVQGAGCRVQGAGSRVQGAGCRVQGARVQNARAPGCQGPRVQV